MLRELATLLDELHDGLTGIETRNGVRLANVDMTLPLELRPVFRSGSCVLLADVPRSSGVDAWLASPSKLTIGWSAGGDFDDTHESARARHPRFRGDDENNKAQRPADAGSLS